MLINLIEWYTTTGRKRKEEESHWNGYLLNWFLTKTRGNYSSIVPLQHIDFFGQSSFQSESIKSITQIVLTRAFAIPLHAAELSHMSPLCQHLSQTENIFVIQENPAKRNINCVEKVIMSWQFSLVAKRVIVPNKKAQTRLVICLSQFSVHTKLGYVNVYLYLSTVNPLHSLQYKLIHKLTSL